MRRKGLSRHQDNHIVIRGGSGLGDSIYLQSVCRHFLNNGYKVEAKSNWRDLFRPLHGVRVVPFNKLRVNRVAHYSARKHLPGTDQFQDCCLSAGITEPVEFKLGWEPSNGPMVQRLRSCPLPVVCVGLPRVPMARDDGFGAELLTGETVKGIQRVIDALRGSVYFVQIGSGPPLFRYDGIDLDLAGKTTVSAMLDVASCASGFLGYVSFLVPLAESMSRPGLYVWSRAGLESGHKFIRAITPTKVFHRSSSRAVVDDEGADRFTAAAATFYNQIRTPAVV